MKLYRFIPLFFILLSSCSSLTVRNDIDDLTFVKDSKKFGIIIRSALKSRVTREDVLGNLSKTISVHNHIKELVFIPDLSQPMVDFTTDDERFYQTSGDSDFLKYKAIGVIKNYLRANADEIKKVSDKHGLDGIIVFEEYAVISQEMQMMRMNSVIMIADKEGNIAYLDHQDNVSDTIETDISAMKTIIANNLTDRFIRKMLDIKFVKTL
jgi:hypothetical protein